MKLSTKLMVSISKRVGHVVMRQELSRLASPSHLSAGLAQLVNEGRLVRLGEGIYAKAFPCQDGKGQVSAEAVDLTRELFAKLNIPVLAVTPGEDNGEPVLWVDTGRCRVTRKLEINGVMVRYVGAHSLRQQPLELPEKLEDLPSEHVRAFIERFAKTHGVKYVRSGLDEYAEAVTRAAGDEVRLDSVGKLLVTLKKNKLINGSQFARLMTNYMREVKSVRSVRRLRECGISA